MPTLTDLPDEIVFVLKRYLDIESVVQLSRTSVRYEQLFKPNPSVRVVNFRNCLSSRFTFKDLAHYLTINSMYLVSLNISYVKVQETRALKTVILKIKTLKHLSLIETGINIKGLYSLVNRNKTITSLDVTSNDLDFPTLRGGLKTLRIFLNILYPPVDLPKVKSLKAVEHVEFIDTLEQTTCWEYGSINLSENEIITFVSLYQTSAIFQIDVFLSSNKREYYHYVLEFYDGFHLSPLLDKEFDCIPQNIRISAEIADSRTRDSIRSLYLCKKASSEGVFEKFKDIVNKVVADAAKHLIFIHDSLSCPIKNGTVMEKQSNAKMYKYITLHDCCLSVAANDDASTSSTSDEACFKKPRLSRIPTDDCVIKEIAEHFKNIETIDVTNKSEPTAKINTGFLDSLKLFEHLNSISLFNLPHINYDGLKSAFESCVFLKTFIYISYEANLPMSRWLSKNLSLCKRIRIIALELHTDDINEFLEPIADCKTLQFIDVMCPNINRKMILKPFVFNFDAMCRFIDKTVALKYFSIVAGDAIYISNSVCFDTKIVERDLNKKYPYKIINLTKCKDFMKRCEYVNKFFDPFDI